MPNRTRRISLLKSTTGNVAIIWAFCGTMIVGLAGGALDFARSQTLRSHLQSAADAAALVAERSARLPLADREARALAMFQENFVAPGMTYNLDFRLVELNPGHRVEADIMMETGISRFMGAPSWRIGVASEARAGAAEFVEVALVLDNTGSMRNDMDVLRDSARDLAETLFDTGADLSMAVVPFVGVVNIGNEAGHMAWMDTNADNPRHGEMVEDRYLGFLDACLPPPAAAAPATTAIGAPAPTPAAPAAGTAGAAATTAAATPSAAAALAAGAPSAAATAAAPAAIFAGRWRPLGFRPIDRWRVCAA
jgi:hypothetical protein